MDYETFLSTKHVRVEPAGFEVAEADVNAKLFPFQRDVVRWALRMGRAALFQGCGLGKTAQQLEWSRHVGARTGKPVLILAPLAVSRQTQREGEKFGIPVTVAVGRAGVKAGVNVSNYEKLEKFDPAAFGGIVLDESSILKSFMGRRKQLLCSMFASTPYRLCCTATPAPNDHMELGNHSQFLGAMDSDEMLSRWFINDTMRAGGYRLKRHAAADFWRWVSSWAVCMTRPSDLGYPDDGFALPPLETVHERVDVDCVSGAEAGRLFRDAKLTATNLHREHRLTAAGRAARVAELVRRAEPAEQWAVWVNTNYEADAVMAALPADVGAVEVRGSDPDWRKEQGLSGFVAGDVRVLVSKPRIAGYGMNLQCCCRTAVVGLSYSFEDLYQLVRRFWRFGQRRAVRVHVVTASSEGDVLAAVKRKEADFERMQREMAAAAAETSPLSACGRRRRTLESYRPTKAGAVPGWLTRKRKECVA